MNDRAEINITLEVRINGVVSQTPMPIKIRDGDHLVVDQPIIVEWVSAKRHPKVRVKQSIQLTD